MKGTRYKDEFKKEAVKQTTERGYSVGAVAKRLGTTTHSGVSLAREMRRAKPATR